MATTDLSPITGTQDYRGHTIGVQGRTGKWRSGFGTRYYGTMDGVAYGTTYATQDEAITRAKAMVDRTVQDDEVRPLAIGALAMDPAGFTQDAGPQDVTVGQTVAVYAKGRNRVGVVTKVGRTNVTVATVTPSNPTHVTLKSAPVVGTLPTPVNVPSPAPAEEVTTNPASAEEATTMTTSTLSKAEQFVLDHPKAKSGGEFTVEEITPKTGITANALRHAVRDLTTAEVLKARREGRTNRYTLVDAPTQSVKVSRLSKAQALAAQMLPEDRATTTATTLTWAGDKDSLDEAIVGAINMANDGLHGDADLAKALDNLRRKAWEV